MHPEEAGLEINLADKFPDGREHEFPPAIDDHIHILCGKLQYVFHHPPAYPVFVFHRQTDDLMHIVASRRKCRPVPTIHEQILPAERLRRRAVVDPMQVDTNAPAFDGHRVHCCRAGRFGASADADRAQSFETDRRSLSAA